MADKTLLVIGSRMTRIQTIIFFAFVSQMTFGQKVFRAHRDSYKANKFVYEFYLFNDSTCYLKGHYADNSVFYLYKGLLRRKNDTLYEFRYQPIVNFTCNKGLHTNDSLRFYIAQKDTVISSLTYKIKTEGGISTTADLQLGRTKIFVKDAKKHDFTVDTKFIDPLTDKMVFFTVGSNSDPDFTYYGTKTDFNAVLISIIKNRLTIFPDKKHIYKKDTFVLIK